MIYCDPPFELGDTLQGSVSGAGSSLMNDHWLGQVFFFPPKGTSGNKKRPVGKGIYAVALRNEAGIALLPKRIALLKEVAGYGLLTAADGYAGGAYAKKNCVFIDPYLPAAGVADDDIFWGIIGGPTTVLNPMVGADMKTDIVVGNFLVASTGTTTGATTSGRIANATIANATSAQDALDVGLAVLARALSAATTHQTTAGQELLVDACIRWK